MKNLQERMIRFIGGVIVRGRARYEEQVQLVTDINASTPPPEVLTQARDEFHRPGVIEVHEDALCVRQEDLNAPTRTVGYWVQAWVLVKPEGDVVVIQKQTTS